MKTASHPSAKRQRPDAYEAQLSPEELSQLHDLLTQPDLSFSQIQAQVPAWRSGSNAGSKPSLRTLSAIAARLRTESHLYHIETTAQVLAAVRDKLAVSPHLPSTTAQILDTLCAILGRALLDSAVHDELAPQQTRLLRMLLKRQDQRLAFARFKYQTGDDDFAAFFQDPDSPDSPPADDSIEQALPDREPETDATSTNADP